MNFLTVGTKINRQIAREEMKWMTTKRALGEEWTPQDADQIRSKIWAQFDLNVRTGLTAMQHFRAIAEELCVKVGRWFFITIRPRSNNFALFYTAVQRLVARKCFQEFTLSFEQKGVSDDELGEGYHAHIVAKMTQRSKAEVIRDVASTMKDICDENFVDVKPTNNPCHLVKNYLVDYVSEDGHKEVTRDWDKKWRDQIGLSDLYTDVPGPLRLGAPQIVDLT